MRLKIDDVEQRIKLFSQLCFEIRKFCVVQDNVATLEVEQVLTKLGKIPFEPLKEEHKEGMMIDTMTEKQLNVLNESYIYIFKQGVLTNLGIGSNKFSTCQICNSMDHVTTKCPRIGNFKPKCGKFGIFHTKFWTTIGRKFVALDVDIVLEWAT